MTDRAVVNCAPDWEGALSLELRRALPECRFTWIADGTALVESERSFEDMARAIVPVREPDASWRPGCVFARYIAPASLALDPDAGLDAMADAFRRACQIVAEGAPWSAHVQTRDARWRSAGLDQTCEGWGREALTGDVSRTDPAWIISLVATDRGHYCGAARADLCLSTWPGGERRYRIAPGRISRSEFKLLEAIEAFGLRLPEQGVALDLGAAPGGWTLTLLDRGLSVIAVDPARLDTRLSGAPGLTAVRSTAESYLESAPPCAALVNDMRLSADASVAVMTRYAPNLQPGGVAVMTAKLPERGITSRTALDIVDRTIATLDGPFRIVGARQLHHNRAEVTIAMVAAE
jgi:23S rRNA (cytidine2498-2'-O)-methyltransferase